MNAFLTIALVSIMHSPLSNNDALTTDDVTSWANTLASENAEYISVSQDSIGQTCYNLDVSGVAEISPNAVSVPVCEHGLTLSQVFADNLQQALSIAASAPIAALWSD